MHQRNPAGRSAAPCEMLRRRAVPLLFLLFSISIASCAEEEDEALPEPPTTTTASSNNATQSSIAFDFLYKEGVSMYLQDNWEECVTNLEQALKGWHYYNGNTARYGHTYIFCQRIRLFKGRPLRERQVTAVMFTC